VIFTGFSLEFLPLEIWLIPNFSFTFYE
jgi:hypothetical protein